MKRVLIVATSRKTRGGITAVLRSWEKAGHWTEFQCYWVQTHRDGPAWRKYLYFAAGMTDFLLRIPFYDIVHIHTADYGTEKRKRVFARLTKFFGKKLIVHLHSSGAEYSIGGVWKELYRYSFTHADMIFALSNAWKEDIVNAFDLDKSKVEVVYNPCPKVMSSVPGQRESYILFAGTLTHRKGYDDLIRAFARVADKMPGWQLKLAGNGELKAGQELAAELGIGNRVEFLGWINGEEKDRAFRHASAYCLPSYSEGFPMGVLDAWAYHLPVISTPVGGLPDVARNGENILLFTPGDVDALAFTILRMVTDPDLRLKLTAESAKFADHRFNMNSISNQLSAIYHSL